MKFLADMGISPRAVEHLRTLGHDAIHLHELGLDRMADTDILAKARAESRVVLTHDLDFGDLLAASQAVLPSVVLFRLPDMRPGSVIRHLDDILAQHLQALESGAILSVSERRVRLRRLPITHA
jgi:predicted nuclease of predicted toxin-antitoxin system